MADLQQLQGQLSQAESMLRQRADQLSLLAGQIKVARTTDGLRSDLRLIEQKVTDIDHWVKEVIGLKIAIEREKRT